MTRAWTSALAALVFGTVFLVAGVALGGDAKPGKTGPALQLPLSSVAALPALAEDPSVELARRAARRERRLTVRRRAAARRAAAAKLPTAPASAEPVTEPAPEPAAPPVAPPVAVPNPAPPPATPPPPPETFDDSG